jgi:hypothetical protein
MSSELERHYSGQQQARIMPWMESDSTTDMPPTIYAYGSGFLIASNG